MKYIVLDFEFNQAFDFDKGESKASVESCPFEIIQIGAIRLNSNFKYEDSLNLLIKPVIYKKIHPYVARITGFREDMLSGSQSFPDALLELQNFVGKKKAVYCVWGANDIKELRNNMDYYNLSSDSTNINFIDVQKIASQYLNHIEGMGIGLKNAVTALDIEMDKPFHDALNDAEYTARILQMLKNEPFKVMQFSYDKTIKIAEPRISLKNILNYIKNKISTTWRK